MDDSTSVTVVDAFEDLLDAVRRIRLRVELPRHYVLEQLASGHAEKGGKSIKICRSTLKKIFILLFAVTIVRLVRVRKLAARDSSNLLSRSVPFWEQELSQKPFIAC